SAFITLAGGATPGAHSVTVPEDAQAVFVLGTYYFNGSGNPLTSITGSFTGAWTILPQLALNAAFPGAFIAHAEVTATGNQTITPVFQQSPSEGPLFAVAFVKDITYADLVRDSGHDGDESTNPVSVTVDSATTDLLIGLLQAFDTPALGTPAGCTSLATGNNVSEDGRLFSVDSSGASTTTVDGVDENYSTLSLVAIKAAGGGGGEEFHSA